MTNTALSNWIDNIGKGRTAGSAVECYAAWVNNRWVRGCRYSTADDYVKRVVDEILRQACG
jgi:hypothetical protein